MTHSRSTKTGIVGSELAKTYAINERMNQILLDHLHPDAWRALPAGAKVRTIAAIVCHVHNIRRKWLRLSAPFLELPNALNRSTCTQDEARQALFESGIRCSEMLAEAAPGGRLSAFHRDGWAKPWPTGEMMFAYMVAHDAHHRGQICMLAHLVGYPLPANATSAMWGWEKLAKTPGMPIQTG